ncbi:hypothetical protein D3C87_2009100 [compost metagenome]
MVIGVADFVGVTVGKLALDPVAFISATVKFSAQKVAEAVAGLATFVANQAQCLVDGVFTHGAVGVLLAREQQRIASRDFM